MEIKFESQTFSKRLKSMLKVDFRRMFTMPLVYIMLGVCFAMPIVMLVMTSMMSGATVVDPTTGAETAMEGFTNAWQAISSFSDARMSMDLTGMANMNMLYFLMAVLVCLFVGDDFRSGYAKNLFAVRSKKTDYVISKSIVCFVGSVGMLFVFFIGAMLGGKIAGLSFDLGTANAGNIIACLLSKFFLAAVFVGIYLTLSVVGKQKLWISILGSFAVGMLMFMMIPMMTPLDASAVHVIMTLAGGALFGLGMGAVSNIILNKTSLV